jgi:hypothetical protein
MDKQRLWGIPSWTIWIAIVIILIFMLVAHCLYSWYYPATTSNSAYWLKVGDALINGAIVGLFIAVVKTIIELPKWVDEFRAKKMPGIGEASEAAAGVPPPASKWPG